MKKMKKMEKSLFLILLLFVWTTQTAQLCTKKIVYAKEYHTQSFSDSFKTNLETLNAAIKDVLKNQGYQIQFENDPTGKFVTGWKSSGVDTHYFNFFGRKDYGLADGLYYKVNVDVIDLNATLKVSISTTIKSIAGPMESSGKLEKKILKGISQYLRGSEIELTNVGMEEKK